MKALDSYTDEELVKTYKTGGDLKVFTTLFMRYDHMIFGVCLKYLEKEDAKDAVMSVYEKIQHDIFEHDVTNFRGWIYVVTRNHCLMKLRTDSKNVQIPFEDSFGTIVESEQLWHPINNESPDMETLLDDCLRRLSKDQFNCVKGFYFDKMSYDELADKFEMEGNKVKSHIQNGKRNLKICIEKKE